VFAVVHRDQRRAAADPIAPGTGVGEERGKGGSFCIGGGNGYRLL